MGKSVKKQSKEVTKGKPTLSATQLRNARKRRSKQKKANVAKKLRRDPSLQYIRNPCGAPIVRKAKSFFAEKKIKFPVILGKTKGWRTLAKLAVRSVDNQLTLGLFQKGSHHLVSATTSEAHHVLINRAADFVQRIARELDVKPFDEEAGTGNLRFVLFSLERSSGKVQISLVWNGTQNKDELDGLCKGIMGAASKYGVSVHSLWVHRNGSWKHSNAIISHEEGSWDCRYGNKNGTKEFLPGQDVPLHFPPTVFRQGNIDAFGEIVNRISSHLKAAYQEKPRCVELYGGVGTIGLHLLKSCRSFTSSDENPFNVDCFQRSLRETSSKVKVKYESLAAAKMLPFLKKAELVIVDPPRKGLDEEVVDALCSSSECMATSLVYVSCGFEAFQRDCNDLITRGGWTLKSASGHVLFPGSDAIETLAFFAKLSC